MKLFSRKKKLNKPKEQSDNDITGNFISFVLLDEIAFDVVLLAKNLESDWNIKIPESDIDSSKSNVVFEIDGMMAAVSLMPGPVPNGEAVQNAKTNWRWPDAASCRGTHCPSNCGYSAAGNADT